MCTFLSSRPPSYLVSFAFGLTMLLSAASTYAQAYGEIRGTTTDESHALIPEVRLRLENEATGTSITTTSNKEGIFILPSLQPGNYRMVGTTNGFADQAVQGINVGVSHTTHIDLVFHVSAVQEKVVVTSQSN